jgi:uncharacterized membrane protein YphA (DoxX/SURF4 family)
MNQSKVYARVSYGLAIAGIGLLHFIFPGFQPVILPLPPEATQHISVFVYLFACYLVITGLLIAVGEYVRPASTVLGYVLLLFLLLGHLPMRLKNHPEIHLYWIDAVKLLAISGGAFVISAAHKMNGSSRYIEKAARITPVGKMMFAAMLINFGMVHLLNATMVGQLVPGWIPFPVFWAYLTGVALVASGASFMFNLKTRSAGVLLATMLLLWLVVLHIPAAIQWKDAVNVVSSLQCLAFASTAITVAHVSKENTRQMHRPDFVDA